MSQIQKQKNQGAVELLQSWLNADNREGASQRDALHHRVLHKKDEHDPDYRFEERSHRSHMDINAWKHMLLGALSMAGFMVAVYAICWLVTGDK